MNLIFLFLSLIASTFTAALPTEDTNVDETDYSIGKPMFHSLQTCGSSSDSLIIHSIELNPDPVKVGSNLMITAKGNLLKEINPGSKVRVRVKLGFVTLKDITFDLCDASKQADIPCPIKTGETSLTFNVEIPNNAPKVLNYFNLQIYFQGFFYDDSDCK